MLLFGSKTRLVAPENALPGPRDPDPRRLTATSCSARR